MEKMMEIFPKNREHLSELLAYLIVGRESRIAIRNSGYISLMTAVKEDEGNVIEFVRNELDAETRPIDTLPRRTENIFFFNPPKFYFFSFFPFLIETIMMTVLGDVMTIEMERVLPRSPHHLLTLGRKFGSPLHRIRIHSPFLARTYTSRDGKQTLSFGKGHRMIVTDAEILSFIYGGKENGLLAI